MTQIDDQTLRELVSKRVRQNVDLALSFKWTLPQHEKQVRETTEAIMQAITADREKAVRDEKNLTHVAKADVHYLLGVVRGLGHPNEVMEKRYNVTPTLEQEGDV